MAKGKARKKKDEWDSITYPSLSESENETIRQARRQGFSVFYPSGAFSETLTLAGAIGFLNLTAQRND